MSFSQTLLLGAIAGATILLGLPVGRLRRSSPTLGVFLNSAAIGVLLFLFWDVLSAAWEPIDLALADYHETGDGLSTALGYGAIFVVGFSVGLLSLVAYEQWMNRAAARPVGPRPGPGAMSVGEVEARGLLSWSAGRRLALLIAVGIGLHNFAEGLAIGQSSASGEVALATALVIGFGLHNATEGFGIVAPLVGDVDDDGQRRIPSWGLLLGLGLIAGGPTFLGTALGYSYTSEPLAVAFLTLAGGSILYVIITLIGIALKSPRRDVMAYGILLGLFAGFATDAILIAAGA